MNRRHPLPSMVLGVFLAGSAFGQDAVEPVGLQSPSQRSRTNELVRAQSLTPYVGVTTAGEPIYGLFAIDPEQGASNTDLVREAREFLAALTPEQHDKATFPVDDPEWRRWSNTSSYVREGLGFDELTEEQREQAFELMRTAFSAKGFALSRDIMRLNHHLGELTNLPDRYSEWFYYLSFMGEPSETEPWGWQLDGHHLVVNYFVLGNQVVLSPLFTGSEPIIAESGRFKGVSIMEPEREKAYAVYTSLTDEQKQAAELELEDMDPEQGGRSFGRGLIQHLQDNVVIPYRGIMVKHMTAEQRALVIELIGEFVSFNREVHARVKMEEVMAYIDETYFGWDTWDASLGEEDPFFFRIQSPVIIIEFDHEGSINLPNSRSDIPIRKHVHTVVRTPNGNDYGRDLLRQHYERHPH
ncbi:MAG: DUF3500 domain-containing protein [Gammaproteobacteria bacterium]|nr:DUF3500 domain-containing protein [Gammaproteobacteria bacterium]